MSYIVAKTWCTKWWLDHFSDTRWVMGVHVCNRVTRALGFRAPVQLWVCEQFVGVSVSVGLSEWEHLCGKWQRHHADRN